MSGTVKNLDITRITHIRVTSTDNLKNVRYLERLMEKMGFNDEIPSEQPAVVNSNTGGLYIWQYPNQFSKYLILLSSLNIQSYIEIGCRWGGTYILTTEYLKRFAPIQKSVAVDIIDSPVNEYCLSQPETEFICMNSTSEEFQEYIADKQFDLVFIDGDHSYDGVKGDFMTMCNHGRVFVFHDITNDACIGVEYFWKELKQSCADQYTFYEFTEQYPEVAQANGGRRYLGIGVAVKI